MSDIQEIELSMDHAKELVERKNAVLKLSNNREFKKIVLDGYFKDEAARLAGLSADVTVKANRDDIFLAIQGISTLRQYFQMIVRMGEVAESELAEYQETLDEARANEEAA
jgi:hypothetical protein